MFQYSMVSCNFGSYPQTCTFSVFRILQQNGNDFSTLAFSTKMIFTKFSTNTECTTFSYLYTVVLKLNLNLKPFSYCFPYVVYTRTRLIHNFCNVLYIGILYILRMYRQWCTTITNFLEIKQGFFNAYWK